MSISDTERQLILGASKDEAAFQQLIALLNNHESNQRKSETILSNLQDVVFETDVQGNFLYLSPAWESITGYSVAESIGKSCSDFVYPADRERNLQKLAALTTGEKASCHHSARYITRAGGYCHLEVHAHLTDAPAPERASIMGVFHDVSEEYKTADRLARSDARYRQMFQTNLAVKLVIDPEDGRIIDANPSACNFYGYSAEQLKSMRIQDINILPDEKIHTEMQRARHEERAFFEFRHRLASGEIRDVDVFSGPVDTEDGRFLFSIIFDVTNRHKAETCYTALFEQSNDAILIMDLNNRLTQVNMRACEMFGYTLDEMLAQSYDDLIVPEEIVHSDAMQVRMLAGENLAPYERTFQRKDGSLLYGEINVQIVFDRDGTPMHVQNMVRDISERKQWETRLRESEARYRSLIEDVLDTSEVATFILDADMRVVWVNRALETYFGLRREDVIGRDKRELIQGRIKYIFADPDAFMQRVFATYDDNTYIEKFICHVLPSGERKERFLKHWSQPVTSGPFAGGRIEHYTDISEQSLSEMALHKQAANMRALLNASFDTVFLMGADGTLLAVNDELGRQLNASVDELIGQNIYSFLSPEVAEDRRRYLDAAVTSGTVQRYESTFAGSNFDIVIYPIADDDGEITRLAVYVQDITDRKIAQEALSRSEERYRRLVQLMPFGITVQRHERILLVNETALQIFGARNHAELLGRSLYDFVHPDYHDLAAKRIEQVMQAEDGRVPVIEAQFIRLDGTPVDVEVTGIRMIYNGEPAMYTIFRDISELRKMRQRELQLLLEKERKRVMADFIKDVTHEFRTPLAIINSSAFLMTRYTDAEKRTRKAEQIEIQIGRITSLVDMLLNIVKLEQQDTLNFVPVDVNQICAEIFNPPQSSERSGPALHVQLDDNLPQVRGDAAYLAEAFKQLLDNAYRFTPDEGTVTVIGGATDETVWVEVQDTGSGITSDALPHIFTTFWRQDSAHSTPGFGLGLTIAQKIIDLHEGTISVETAVGEGSFFRITLPVRDME